MWDTATGELRKALTSTLTEKASDSLAKNSSDWTILIGESLNTFGMKISHLTTRLEQAFTEASKLPPKEQDALADWVLAELHSEKRWDGLFAGSQKTLSKLAAEALAEHRRGQTQELDPDQL